MAKRGGPSISVKMILTTTLLIVVTVVGSGFLNVVNVRRAFESAVDERIKTFREGRSQLGIAGMDAIARGLTPFLIDHHDPEIELFVKGAVPADNRTDDKGRLDYGLRMAFVLDQNQQVIVHCVEKAKLECSTPSEHVAMSAKFGELARSSWEKALAAWKANGPVLASLELADGAVPYSVLAFPIFSGEPPTAAAAWPAEPLTGSRVGYVVLGYDLSPIARFAADAAVEKATAVKKAALYTGVVGLLFALIGTILAIFQGLSISRPIRQLAWRADQIARGNLDTRVEITSSDEIGLLGENFNFMADQISILLQQTAEKAKLEQELEVAKTIQETLVPSDAPVKKPNLTFAGFYQPAAQTGGDWWTWAELPDGKILLVIGDVTGHGIPSAMITAAAKSACDVARFIHEQITVTRLLEIMNRAIYESAQRRFVMTCFASIVDTKARTITYANAGHNFPYLYRQSEGKGEFGSLMIRGNRLGDDPTSTYDAKTTDLAIGDVLVWYTDGIVECENAAGEEYGEKRFRASVKKAAALDASEMRDAIVADAATYFGETNRKDDITMVVGRIT